MTRLAHTSFVVERALPGRPARAFRYFAELELKRRWTQCHPDWREIEVQLDFRIGGAELSRLRAPDGAVHAFRAHYLDIVVPARIVYAFTMRVDDALVSSSLATIELTAAGRGTAMHYTEHAAFVDAAAIPGRRDGTGHGFDRLAATIERSLATVQ